MSLSRSRSPFSSRLTGALGLVGLLGAALSGCGGGAATQVVNAGLITPGGGTASAAGTIFNNPRASSAAACTANAHQSGRARWTVLVYINAANNLQPDSFFNVAQMASTGSDATNLNIVIQWKQATTCNYFSTVNACSSTSSPNSFALSNYAAYTPDDTRRYYLLPHNQTDVTNLSNGDTSSLENANERLPNPTTNTLHDNPADATTPLTSDMGSYQTLQNFVQWGASHYPADHLAVVIWDHGSGPLPVINKAVKAALKNQRGVSATVVNGAALSATVLNGAALSASVPLTSPRGLPLASGRFVPASRNLKSSTRGLSQDANTGNQILTQQLPLGLANPPQGIDALIIDCSLQCTAEMAFDARNSSRLFVGSEESPPGTGYPYDVWLADVKSNGQNPCVVGTELITEDLNVYAPGGSENAYQNNNVTQAMIDLSQMNSVASAINAFGSSLLTHQSALGSLISAARVNTHAFEFPELKDLYDFAYLVQTSSGVPSDLATAAYNVEYAMTNASTGAVLMSAHGPSGEAQASGLSIYLPDPGASSSVDYTTGYDPAYNSLGLAIAAPGWPSFLQAEAPSQ